MLCNLTKRLDFNKSYILKNSFWWFTGKAGEIFISFAVLFAFASWLPKEEYGIYQFVIAAFTLFNIFTLPGINLVLIRSIAQKKEGSFEVAVKEKIKWGLIGSLFSFGTATFYFLKGNILLGTAFLIVGAFLPFEETFRVFISFWNGKKNFDLQAKYNIFSAGLSAIFLILIIYLTNNILIIIATFFISHTIFDWIFYKKTKKQTSNNDKDPDMVSFGKHLTLINAIEIAANQLDKIIIWKFLGALQVAVYVFAQLPIQRLKAALPITALALPKLSENKINKERKYKIISNSLWMFLATIPLAIILALMAPLLYKFLFSQYVESIIYFQVLCVTIALSPFLLLNSVLIAEIKKRELYIINIGIPLLKIFLFFVLIAQFEIWGVIITVLITEFLKGLLLLYFFLKI